MKELSLLEVHDKKSENRNLAHDANEQGEEGGGEKISSCSSVNGSEQEVALSVSLRKKLLLARIRDKYHRHASTKKFQLCDRHILLHFYLFHGCLIRVSIRWPNDNP